MNYIDLGLPSGTLWADTNEEGYFDFDEAKEKFGNNLPSIELWEELIENCKWEWNDVKKGYDVEGINGKSIFLPAAGYRAVTGLHYAGSFGLYWSSSLNSDYFNRGWDVGFNFAGIERGYDYCFFGQSVRLVKRR